MSGNMYRCLFLSTVFTLASTGCLSEFSEDDWVKEEITNVEGETGVDGGGVSDTDDNCPDTHNPMQTDVDHDNIDDARDNCIQMANSNQADYDGDGYGDVCDTCPIIANPDQSVYEMEEATCACSDFDGDGYFNGPGCPPGISTDCEDWDEMIHPGAREYCDGADFNCDGIPDDGEACGRS